MPEARNPVEVFERKQRDGYWLWASKPALEQIRKYSEQPESCILVYLALCIIASDEKKETFQAAHSWIGAKCGQSRRTVMRRIAELELMNLVRVERAAFKEASHYTLLRCVPSDTSTM